MKTNPIARRLVRIRSILLCAALFISGGLELYFGASFVGQMGQPATMQSASPVSPNIHLGALMDAAR